MFICGEVGLNMTFSTFNSYLVIFFVSVFYVNSQDPKVNTTVGEIIGKAITVPVQQRYIKVNISVHQYLGIPFAKPPIGDLRFRKPKPVTTLPSPFYAHNYGAKCPQRPLHAVSNATESEDCLFLNVYIPDHEAELPGGHAVMIWLHGGGFQEGAGSDYDFTNFSAYGNVIVVTINYRLGMFGFLSARDGNTRGNFGLWDQHMAFKWVHDNIWAFGGNNMKVTIAGAEAGAMSVTQHAYFPGNKGLFQRIIAQSGTMSTPLLSLDRDRSEEVHILAESVWCKTNNSFDMLDCLRTKSVDDLMAYQNMYSPTLDGKLIRINTRDIAKIAETKTLDEVEFFRSLDVMSGFNANEGVNLLPMVMHFLPKELRYSNLEDLQVDFGRWKEDYVPTAMESLFQRHFPDEIIQLIAAQYTPWPEQYNSRLFRLQFEKLLGDSYIAIPLIQMARLHSNSYESTGNTYMYHFVPKPSVRSLRTPSWVPGAGSGDEIKFMLGSFGLLGVGEENDWENELMMKMMRYWSNFVKTGGPNSPDLRQPFWDKYDREIGEYLILNETMTSMPGPRLFYAEEANFWLHVFPDLVANRKYCGNTSAARILTHLNWSVLFALSAYIYIV